MSINRGMDTGVYVGVGWGGVEYYSATKKNEILPFAATWMDLETVVLSKISQRRRNSV